MKQIKRLLFAMSWLCAFYYLSYPNSLKSFYDGYQATLDTSSQMTSQAH